MSIDRRQFSGSLIATLFFHTGWFNERQLPPIRPGFSWFRSSHLEAHIPCPQGWQFREESMDKTAICFLTRPNSLFHGGVPTEVTIQLIPDLKCDGIEIDESNCFHFADEHGEREDLKLNADAGVVVWSKRIVGFVLGDSMPHWKVEHENNQFYTYGVEALVRADSDFTIDRLIRTVGVGNKLTQAFYLMTFETPADLWETDRVIADWLFEMFEANPCV